MRTIFPFWAPHDVIRSILTANHPHQLFLIPPTSTLGAINVSRISCSRTSLSPEQHPEYINTSCRPRRTLRAVFPLIARARGRAFSRYIRVHDSIVGIILRVELTERLVDRIFQR